MSETTVSPRPAASPAGRVRGGRSPADDRGSGRGRSRWPVLVRVFGHELRSLAADRSLAWVAILFTVLAAYAIYNGAAWARFQERAIARVLAEDSARSGSLRLQVERIAQGTEEPPSAFRDPRRPSVAGGSMGRRHAVLPPAPLAAFAVGQSDLYPSYVPVSTQSREVLLAREEIENPLHLLAGRFDFAFVIVFLYPLLILALGYNLLSQEREEGTLALLLSQPVRLGTVVAGKVLARFVPVVGLAILLGLIGALAGGRLGEPGGGRAFLLWALVAVAYGAFWFAVAVAVDGLGRGSATSAVALAAIWLLLVIVVPSFLNNLAASIHPVPSRAEMIGATREAARRVSAEGSAVLARYYEDHPELAPRGAADLEDFATRAYAVQERVEARIRPVRARFETQMARQRELVAPLRFLSPALLAQEAIDDAAGTGEPRYRHFLSQVDAYHAAWRGYFGRRIYRQEQLSEADFRTLPAWRYREEPAARAGRRIVVSLLGLLGAAALAGAIGGILLRRYPRAA